MLCKLSRWMVSRAEDTGNTLPRFVERHAGRCAACGQHARSSASLSSRLREERAAWLAKVPDFSVSLEGETGRAMAGGQVVRTERPGRRLLSGLRPLPVAAAALAVVAGALVLFQVVLREPSPSAEDRAAARAVIKSIVAAPDGFRSALTGAESSLEKEQRILEKSVASAVEYLQARLNIRIERRNPPKEL